MATVTLRRKELERALKLAAKVTPRRCNLPVLGNARLTVNGAVRLAVTDKRGLDFVEREGARYAQKAGGYGAKPDTSLAVLAPPKPPPVKRVRTRKLR